MRVIIPRVDALAQAAPAVPGVGVATALVAVSPAGADDPRLAKVWTADDLLAAWEKQRPFEVK